MRTDLESTADELYGKLEMAEAPGDPYAAQLAKSKATRVQSAEKVLERAKKTIEKANKPKAAPKVRGKGRRSGVKHADPTGGALPPGNGQGDATTSPPEIANGKDQGDAATSPPEIASASAPVNQPADHHPNWPEKETSHLCFLL